MAQTQVQTDRDLASIAEARSLARRAKAAAPALAESTQDQIDAYVDAMAAAITPQAEALARLATEETGYGVVDDKIQKNLFASEKVYKFIRPMKTVGVVRRLDDRKVIEIAEPFGVVAASSVHQSHVHRHLQDSIPEGAVSHRHQPASRSGQMHHAGRRSDERRRTAGGRARRRDQLDDHGHTGGTQELMKAREVAVILATGGMGLVRAAYSAGKPAYGVGPGNAPAFIERTADMPKAVRDIVTGKTFDNGAPLLVGKLGGRGRSRRR